MNCYNGWAAIRKRAKAVGFLTLSDVTPGEQPTSPFGSENKSRQCDKIVVIQDPEVHNALAIAEVHIRSWPAAQTDVATDEDLAGCSRQ